MEMSAVINSSGYLLDICDWEEKQNIVSEKAKETEQYVLIKAKIRAMIK